ncbi:30S ribosomal protein S1 [Candidatus Desantisbacteria bacterium CG2_30_40_21]|uniref:30S ribosomal protein S1 n=5 Tax=unclassified Candidatus Desantisiibacteriota TaxID=3106372 RepID=A0A2M7J960_9BACT|nr:MAG: 30S ribosomal protein S1 [Candidatus Desantisbacteria bacterium CG2_30_40_21]PIP40861.1 MAG: 30S ribosomal protein S1 [Candidatus Desantisbacteria bacterium CG23_combo_of_CG06-09_8_20_14_all_40_23]PIX15947.1 MAG: 30S ribosomal protein S1 [Candidatus Desantisbacteria bacterium CG_4_8_14_3_um_filter_40_12]PIY19892.1 MAG: 30S ribosomal protein S1 [Candidatus Desantisbacteria bacterium CG_4_10_14_3_um_filter_40_18]PJB29829.1 MAG: 30S ribosomal protein S1 [Candidatus Desantisbacteria bacteri
MSLISQEMIDRAIERTKEEIAPHEKIQKKEEECACIPLPPLPFEERDRVMEIMEVAEPQEVVESVENQTIDQSYEIQEIKEGMIIPGVVEKIDTEGILVSIQGCKSEGIIPLDELSNRAFSSPEEVVSVGDTIKVCILEVEGKEGNPILSKKQADMEDAWEKMIKSYETGEILSCKVVDSTKGGLIVDLDIRGFVPFSQIDISRPANLNSYLGKTLRVRIIEINRQGNNLVLSQRQVLEEEYDQKKKMFFDSFVEGMVCDGVVSKITSFGAFIDLGGIDGLAHLSEISWTRIKHPGDVLKQGDMVKVVVIRVNKDTQKVSLSIKQATIDPWKTAAERYNIGDMVSGNVVGVSRTVAFIYLEDGVEGILPISEISTKRISSPSEVLSERQNITAKVIDVDFSRRRIVLSIRQVMDAAEKNATKDYMKSQNQGTGMTLGDMFKDKFEGLIAGGKGQ